MQRRIYLTLTTLAIGLLLQNPGRAQVPYISTSSLFGRDTTADGIASYAADAANLYNTAAGAFNFNSGRPDATATGSTLAFDQTLDGTRVRSSASGIGGGFYVAKNYASVNVDRVPNVGYIAAGVYGSQTQLKFLVAPSNAAYSVFKWDVTGASSTSPNTGYAGSVLRFLAGYYPTETYNSIFNVAVAPPGVQILENSGTLRYNLPIVLGQNIDLFYQATASVQLKQTEAATILGSRYTAEADYASTTILDRIDLFDANNNRITTNWVLADATTGQALFDQNGRIGASATVPEPGTLVLIGTGLFPIAGLAMRRRK